jgi:hypothetical protein
MAGLTGFNRIYRIKTRASLNRVNPENPVHRVQGLFFDVLLILKNLVHPVRALFLLLN